jgi:photosystem II stability/assembly factor-like uncharacterized protein
MNWTKAPMPESLPINSVAADGSNLIAGSSGGGILVSTDDGSTWKPFNDGLTNLDVLSIVNDGGRFFAGTKNGVFVTEFGRNSSQPPAADSQTVTADEDAKLAIKLTGSDPDGDPIKYTIVTNPKHGYLSGGAPNLTYTPRENYFGEDSFTFITSDFAGASAPATVTINVRPVDDPLELYVAGDENAIVGGLVVVNIYGFDADGEKVKVTATRLPQDAVFDQRNDQSSALVKWVPKNDGIYTLSFTASEENGASVTKDFKVTVTAPQPTDGWSQVPLFIDKRVTEILVNGSTIYLGLSSVGSEVSSALARSKDNGRTWTMIGNGLPVNVYSYDIANGGAALYLACSEGLFRSTDDGTNWNNIGGGKGLPADGKFLSIAAQGNRVLAWNPTRIFISLDAGGAWTEVTGNLPTQLSGSPSVPGGQINTATVSGDAALVSLPTGFLGGIPITYRSTDNGASWQSANQGLTGPYSIIKFVVDGNRLYGFDVNSTYYSDDHGANWQLFNPNPKDYFPAFPTDLASAVKDGLLLVLYRDGVMRISTDNGNNWSALDAIPNESVKFIAIGDLSLFAVSGGGKLFVHPRLGIKSDQR